ncbi:hypothetical protein ES703_120733 [subsurface metagenome]
MRCRSALVCGAVVGVGRAPFFVWASSGGRWRWCVWRVGLRGCRVACGCSFWRAFVAFVGLFWVGFVLLSLPLFWLWLVLALAG